jgi:hypothetical protein
MRAPRCLHPLPPLAAAAALLLPAGLGAADGPANKTGTIFKAAEAAVDAGRVQRSKPLGFHNRGGLFTELPADGALLVGFDVGIGKFLDIETVYALRPIYQTAFGENSGKEHGLFYGQRKVGKRTYKSKVLRRVRVMARPGYAVGGVTVRSGLNINGLSLTFMRVSGRALDPDQSYASEWVGDRTGGGEASISGDGAPVVGVHGSQDVEHVSSLGLIYMPVPPAEAEAPVAAPRTEEAPERPAPAPRVEAPEPPPAPAQEERAQAPAAAPKEEKKAEAPAAPNPARDEDRPWPAPKPKPQRVVQAEPTTAAPEPSGGNISIPFFALVIVVATSLLAALGGYVRKRHFLDKSAGALDVTKVQKPSPRTLPATPATPPASVASTGICGGPRPAAATGRTAPQGPPEEDNIPEVLPADAGQDEQPRAKPNFRVYYHVTCGKATIVSGDDYVILECPFRPVSGTYCCGCKTFVPLHLVRWADSDELLAAYRERVRAMVPFWRQVYLALFANAYEGAINWGKEWKGGPLPERH